jgi:hypothetical protein
MAATVSARRIVLYLIDVETGRIYPVKPVISPDGAVYLAVNLSSDSVGVAKEETLQAVKAQIDKLNFTPEGFLRSSVAGSEVMVPTDIQSSFIQVPVDIQSSFIQVPVDIQGQFVDLFVRRKSYRTLVGSTTTALAANASITLGPWDAIDYRSICISVFADQAGTLYIEQSPNNTNWDVSEAISVSANVGQGIIREIAARYVRVRYVNGPAAQTVFRLYVWLRGE